MPAGQLHELYTFACGLYTLWALTRLGTLLYNWAVQGLAQFYNKVSCRGGGVGIEHMYSVYKNRTNGLLNKCLKILKIKSEAWLFQAIITNGRIWLRRYDMTFSVISDAFNFNYK